MSAPDHPLVVHFVVACLLVGVALRWTALLAPIAFAGPAAAVLLALGAGAAVAAVASGEEARVAAESVPGSAAVVRAHALWGRWTRNVFVVVAGLEGLALLRPRQVVLVASGVLGLVGAACVVQAGHRGGELVYAHAAGVGVRSGDPIDVGRLLLAGLHHQAALDEREGRAVAAAELRELAVRRFPDEPAVRIEAAESALHDRQDAAAALALARATVVPPDDRDLRFRLGWVEAESLLALGDGAGGRRALLTLAQEFPDSGRVRRRLEGLGGGSDAGAGAPVGDQSRGPRAVYWE